MSCHLNYTSLTQLFLQKYKDSSHSGNFGRLRSDWHPAIRACSSLVILTLTAGSPRRNSFPQQGGVQTTAHFLVFLHLPQPGRPPEYEGNKVLTTRWLLFQEATYAPKQSTPPANQVHDLFDTHDLHNLFVSFLWLLQSIV